MDLLRFIPLKLTLLLVLGIFLGSYLPLGIFLSLTLTGSFLLLLGFLFYRGNRVQSLTRRGKGPAAFGIIMALTVLSLGILSVSLAHPDSLPDHYSHKNVMGDRLWKIKVREVLKPTVYSHRYVAQVLALENEKASGKILISLPVDSLTQKLEVDDELMVYTGLTAINPPLNPHQFDYRHYMAGLGITHQMRLRRDQFFTEKKPDRTLYGRAAAIRHRIRDKLKEANFGKEELGIIQALLLGQRDDISPETYDNYKDAGAVHILAVSGLHIGILLLLLQFLLRPLERLPTGKTVKLIFIVALLWGFALLAGLSASVVRAVTMFSFVAYALYLNRPGNTFNILALSMFFILLVNDPMLLFQVGFQMSYAAVFAILWIYPLLQRLWNPKYKLLRYFWQLLSVSIAAQLGVLPISLFYFHQFPGLFFISNLLIVPALGVILGMGILVIFLALLGRLPDVLVTLYDTLIVWMNTIVAWVARQEGFVFQNIPFDAIQLVLAYGILFYGIIFLSNPRFKKGVALALAIIGFRVWLFHTSYRTRQKEALFVAHQTRNSILMHQRGTRLSAVAHDTTRLGRMVSDYRIAERIGSIDYGTLQNSYRWQQKNLLIIDSSGIYPKNTAIPEYVVLTGSPKLNLERLIDSIHPKTVIADGSNYRSYIHRWKKTCEKRKLPFHYTGEMGAYYFE